MSLQSFFFHLLEVEGVEEKTGWVLPSIRRPFCVLDSIQFQRKSTGWYYCPITINKGTGDKTWAVCLRIHNQEGGKSGFSWGKCFVPRPWALLVGRDCFHPMICRGMVRSVPTWVPQERGTRDASWRKTTTSISPAMRTLGNLFRDTMGSEPRTECIGLNVNS